MTDVDPFDFSGLVDKPSPTQSGRAQPGPPVVAPANRVGIGRGDAGSGFTFDEAAAATGGMPVVGRAPVWLLLACALVVVAAAITAWRLGGQPTMAIVSWVASGPVAIGLLAAFTAVDTRQRALSTYSSIGWVKPAYVACLVLCGIAVCGSALRIALWVGRL